MLLWPVLRTRNGCLLMNRYFICRLEWWECWAVQSHVTQGQKCQVFIRPRWFHSNSLLISSLCKLLSIRRVCIMMVTFDLCSQAVAAEFQNESAAALAAAATRHLQEAEQAKNSGNEHWWGETLTLRAISDRMWCAPRSPLGTAKLLRPS